VSGRVDQVELELLAGRRRIRHAHSVELDRDSAFALQVHVVEDLRFHFPLLERASRFDQPVGQSRLAVIDMCDNAEIADMIELHGRLSGVDDGGELIVPFESSDSRLTQQNKNRARECAAFVHVLRVIVAAPDPLAVQRAAWTTTVRHAARVQPAGRCA
jgi:hypothetical protein